MWCNCLYGSLTRISPIPEGRWEVAPLPREAWGTGDYVVGEVTHPSHEVRLELPNGRFVEPMAGDWIVGAFGKRAATLEAVGDWEAIEEDGKMHVMGGGGVFGRVTSISPFLPKMVRTRYVGHVHVAEQPVRMQDFVPEVPPRPLEVPIVLVIGTSMSSGKTMTAKVAVHLLRRAGWRVVAGKLTGSGRYHDVLYMQDAGAEWVYDFVDVGLPTTIYPPEAFRPALRTLLAMMAAVPADVAVIEAGASPLEPYNGAVAIEEIADNVCCTVMAASDPYAVLGLIDAYGGSRPDVVTGIATNTTAGCELLERLSGIEALNVREPEALPRFKEILLAKLEQITETTETVEAVERAADPGGAPQPVG